MSTGYTHYHVQSVTIRFTVLGRPQQRGSKQAFVPLDRNKQPFRRPGGGVVVSTVDDNAKSKSWMQEVRCAARRAYSGELITDPAELAVRFYFARPQSHFGSGKNAGQLKASAPAYHAGTPDLDKLLRCLCDSLSGVVLRDDKQIVRFADGTGRYWTTEAERAEVTINVLGDR